MRTAPVTPPDSALFIRPDALGDVVLFSPVMRRLRATWPKTRIAVVVRQSFVSLAELLAPGVEWIGTTLDPYLKGPSEGGAELDHLRSAVSRFAPQLVVAACARRHWLDAALAAAAPTARRVAFVTAAPDPYYEVGLRFELKVDTVSSFPEILPALPEDEDWKRNFGLLDALLGETVAPTAPTLELGDEWLGRADRVLADLKLEPGGFVTCAAAGFANVSLKTWPPERFAEVIGWLWKKRSCRSLLIGQANERDYVSRIARASGAGAAEIWTGGDGELPMLAALLKRSKLHFGNDTGAVHLAAAVGTPVVTIFGGGTWPRFVPASVASISVVRPLPCFGCGWECAFGDAPCVKSIEASDVRRALKMALRRRGRSHSRILALPAVSLETAGIMVQAAAISAERAAAQMERERKLKEIAYLAGEKDVEIESLKGAANEKDAEIGALKQAANEKDREILEKDGEILEKDKENRMLLRVAEERLVGLKANHDEAAARLEKLLDLDRTCTEQKRRIDLLEAERAQSRCQSAPGP